MALSENEYSDERILEILKRANYDVDEAIQIFFE